MTSHSLFENVSFGSQSQHQKLGLHVHIPHASVFLINLRVCTLFKVVEKRGKVTVLTFRMSPTLAWVLHLSISVSLQMTPEREAVSSN